MKFSKGKDCPKLMHQWLLVTLFLMLALSSKAYSDISDIFAENSHLYIQTSLYTEHFTPKPEHNNHQRLIDFNWHWKSKYFVGYSHFRNSFSQPTNYFYVGHQWDIPKTNNLLYASLTGGFAHGYDGEKKDEIPLNGAGVAPIVLPLVGIRYNNIHSQLILFGTAGYTITAGIDIPL